jgi:hypothetical protein
MYELNENVFFLMMGLTPTYVKGNYLGITACKAKDEKAKVYAIGEKLGSIYIGMLKHIARATSALQPNSSSKNISTHRSNSLSRRI